MSDFTRYMTPGGGGIAESACGLLYHRKEVDPAIDALRNRIEELEAEVAALRASLKVLDDEPTITVAEHVDICAFLGAHLPQAAAITKGQADG